MPDPTPNQESEVQPEISADDVRRWFLDTANALAAANGYRTSPPPPPPTPQQVKNDALLMPDEDGRFSS